MNRITAAAFGRYCLAVIMILLFTALAPCLAATQPGQYTYEEYIGGVRETEANRGAVTGAGLSGGICYDPATATLTLTNAVITGSRSDGEYEYGIYSGEALNIVLNGGSLISLDGTDCYQCYGIYCAGALDMSGSGSISVMSGGARWISAGLRCAGSFSNGAELTLRGGYGYYKYSGGIQGYSYGLYAEAGITNRQSGVITAVSTATLDGGGIYCEGIITNRGDITAICGDMMFDSAGIEAGGLENYGRIEASVADTQGGDSYSAGDSYGIRVNGTALNSGYIRAVSGTAYNTYGLSADGLSVTGTLDATAAAAAEMSRGVYVTGLLSNSGTLTGTANDGGYRSGVSCGIYADGREAILNLDGGDMRAYSSAAHSSYGIYAPAVDDRGSLLAVSDTEYAGAYGIYAVGSISCGEGGMIRACGYDGALYSKNGGISFDGGTVLLGADTINAAAGMYTSAHVSAARDTVRDEYDRPVRSAVAAALPADMIKDSAFSDTHVSAEYGDTIRYDIDIAGITAPGAYGYSLSVFINEPFADRYEQVGAAYGCALRGETVVNRVGRYMLQEQIVISTADGITLGSSRRNIVIDVGKKTVGSLTVDGTVQIGTELNMGYTLTCADPTVETCYTAWYCGGQDLRVDMTPCEAGYALYDAHITLTAAYGYRFTGQTAAYIFGEELLPVRVSDSGTSAEYWAATAVICAHESAKWENDDVSHWRTCALCGEIYDLAAHTWGDPVITNEKTTYECTVCGEKLEISSGKTGLKWTYLLLDRLKPGETLPVPEPYRAETVIIDSYEWYRNGTSESHRVAPDSTAAEGSYYMKIRLVPKEDYYYSEGAYAYISGDKAHLCEVNSDGSLTAEIELECRRAAEVVFTLPEISAGMKLKDVRDGASVTEDGGTPIAVTLSVCVPNEEMTTIGGYSFMEGEWQSGTDLTLEETDAIEIAPGSTYVLLMSALLTNETNEDAVTVNGAKPEKYQVDLPLGGGWPMLTAYYVCAPQYDISAVTDGSGLVTGSGSYELGDSAKLTAYGGPDGRSFYGWVTDGRLVSRANPLSWFVTEDTELTAIYADPQSIFTLPESAVRIDGEAFSGTAAEMIVIPAGCGSIAPDAFDGCPNLRYIIDRSQLNISAPAGVEVISAEG